MTRRKGGQSAVRWLALLAKGGTKVREGHTARKWFLVNLLEALVA